jgi:hypothetical protein
MGTDRKRIFICSPFAGDVIANIIRAKALCREAVDMGVAPFAPHLHYTRFLPDVGASREVGIECGLVYLETSAELWYSCAGNNLPTNGMQREIDYARELGIPVMEFSEARRVHGGG